MFDFFFTEEGTHKVAINNQPSYYTQYKAGRRDTVKWARANKAERGDVLPEQARDVVTQLSYTRAESSGRSSPTVVSSTSPETVARITFVSARANSESFWRQPPQGGTGRGLSAMT